MFVLYIVFYFRLQISTCDPPSSYTIFTNTQFIVMIAIVYCMLKDSIAIHFILCVSISVPFATFASRKFILIFVSNSNDDCHRHWVPCYGCVYVYGNSLLFLSTTFIITIIISVISFVWQKQWDVCGAYPFLATTNETNRNRIKWKFSLFELKDIFLTVFCFVL